MRSGDFVVAVLCLAVTAGCANAKARQFIGFPKVIDGDTVQFAGVKLRIMGIDAPQTDQLCFDHAGKRWKCGVAAREYLKQQAGNKSWKCDVVRKNLYGRLLARCRAGDEDIAGQMVQAGWALASTTGPAAYRESEEVARASEAGLWAGAFVAPLDWRRRNRQARVLGKATVQARASAPLLMSAFGTSPPSADCAIKGNVNWSGKCIFHTPAGHRYKRIAMQAKYGDRWFCTPTEAIASGCRETKR